MTSRSQIACQGDIEPSTKNKVSTCTQRERVPIPIWRLAHEERSGPGQEFQITGRRPRLRDEQITLRADLHILLGLYRTQNHAAIQVPIASNRSDSSHAPSRTDAFDFPYRGLNPSDRSTRTHLERAADDISHPIWRRQSGDTSSRCRQDDLSIGIQRTLKVQ